MSVNFLNSETKLNLMRAFAGESQARNRYTIAAAQAKTQKLHVIEAIFTFTANQEREHAEIFYNYLKESAGESITVEGGYPVDINSSVAQLLRFAQHNELEEYENVYQSFGQTASDEGFAEIAFSFNAIAKIEKVHADRFAKYAELLEQNRLFVSDTACKWMCLNCGHVFEGTEAPDRCPVCSHNKGFFIRFELSPYEPVSNIL